MALPTRPKRLPRDRTLSIRMSSQCIDNLKMLASLHNLTQADVVEILVNEEMVKIGGTAAAKKKARD